MVINCKKPCKKKRSTMLTVEQMVDIALGAPEIGAVNFNILHALIHVIIQQLNIQKCLVEFKGYDSDRMEGIILSAKPGPILKLSEYMIDLSGGKTCTSKEKTSKQPKEEEDAKDEEVSSKPCEERRKKKRDEEKEKSDKGKEESDTEETKKIFKKTLAPEECEEIDEPEPKKVKKVPKPCPCKGPPKETDVAADESLKREPSSYYGSDSEGTCQTIVRVEPVGEKCDSWRSRPALAHESMVKLEEKVAMLQDAFEALEKMPTNEELKKRALGGTCESTPVKDLWQLYNLNKRVEGCEGTIEKLASMIEDLVKETCNQREALLVIADAVDEMECADETGRSCCAALQGRSGAPPGPPGMPPAPPNTATATRQGETQTVTFSDVEPKHEDNPPPPAAQPPSSKHNKLFPCKPTPLQCKQNSQSHPPPNPPEPEKPAPEQTAPEPKPESAPPAEAPPPSPPAATAAASAEEKQPKETQAQPEVPPPVTEALNIGVEQGNMMLSGVMGIGPEFNKMSSGEKFCLLKENVNCLISQMRDLTTNFPIKQIAGKLCAMISMEKQLDTLDKEWRAFCETFNPAGVLQLSPDITVMKSNIDNLLNNTSKLLMDKKEAEERFQNINKETDYLMRAKADLELVQDELAGKADAALVNRKVSHDQFDAACDDLTRGLDEALKRLMQQEGMWNEAMEELQKDLDNKLDKNDIMPLKEFINKKLKCLQDKLKQLAKLRKDAEAAGAKSRILRNLNCISCDADVIMRMDNKIPNPRHMLNPPKGLKPILSFQLDQVRKAMKKGFPCRGATNVEETVLDAQRKSAGLPLTTRDAVENKMSKLAHFCNRYCGGSHTITTPQQRVTRIGHFLTEFGPQALAMYNQELLETTSNQEAETPPGALTSNADLSKPC